MIIQIPHEESRDSSVSLFGGSTADELVLVSKALLSRIELLESHSHKLS